MHDDQQRLAFVHYIHRCVQAEHAVDHGSEISTFQHGLQLHSHKYAA